MRPPEENIPAAAVGALASDSTPKLFSKLHTDIFKKRQLHIWYTEAGLCETLCPATKYIAANTNFH
jgi:hypothetical protein